MFGAYLIDTAQRGVSYLAGDGGKRNNWKFGGEKSREVIVYWDQNNHSYQELSREMKA